MALPAAGVAPEAHRLVVPAEELRRSFQAQSLDALTSDVPKPTSMDPGERLGGRSPAPHDVGSAAAEGS